MVIINKSQYAVGMTVTGKIGRPLWYGKRIFATTHYGETEPGRPKSPYGIQSYGRGYYGWWESHFGVYRMKPGKRGRVLVKSDFYRQLKPYTPTQIAVQNNFKFAVAAWNSLTPAEKAVYNARAVKKPLYGYNIFLKEYMASH